jgi:hypothetical protein
MPLMVLNCAFLLPNSVYSYLPKTVQTDHCVWIEVVSFDNPNGNLCMEILDKPNLIELRRDED